MQRSFPKSGPAETGERSARPDLLAWSLVVGLGLIWGASFATTGAAVREAPPLTVACARLAIAAALLVPLAYAFAGGLPTWRTDRDRRVWRAAIGCAFLANAAPFALLSWAQTEISSGLAGVFMASLPLITPALAVWLIPGERFTRERLVGVSIGFAGVAALIGYDAFSELGAGGAIELLAQLACLLAATGYALGAIVARLGPGAHPVSFGAATMTAAALMLAPFVLIFEWPGAGGWSGELSWAGWLSVLYLGVFPTALAIVMLYEVVRRAGPTFLSLVNYMVPLWAVLFGALMLGESVPPQTPVALALILGGVAISEGLWRRMRKKG